MDKAPARSQPADNQSDPSVQGGDGQRNPEQAHPKPYEGSCLRPLGLCELGGCCDLCIHNPDQPRTACQTVRLSS